LGAEEGSCGGGRRCSSLGYDDKFERFSVDLELHFILVELELDCSVYRNDGLFGGLRLVAKYDIFRKTNDSVVWVEAVEDIVAVKNRLISLGSADEYRVWDSTEQRFVDVLDDCA
jgi:hypothetical protein